MPQWRLVVKDSGGTSFRLLKIGSGIDKYRDPYIKVLFPDLKNVPISFFHKPGGVNKSDWVKGKFHPTIEATNTGLEYSFHFGSRETAAHFKEPTTDKHTQGEHRTDPLARVVEMLSVDIYDFSQSKTFTKQTSPQDIVLDHPLLSPTRFRIICMPNDVNYRIKVDDSPTTTLTYQHSIDLGEFGMRLLILEESLLDIPPDAKGLVIYKLDIHYTDKSHTEHTKESFERLTTISANMQEGASDQY